MTGWRKQPVGDLPLYQARTMAWLPRVVQGFTTRHGGVSVAPYESLNLGGHVGDIPASVQANRQRLWADLGFTEAQVALAEQVHGAEVARVTAGGASVPGADALVTGTPGVLLLLFFADCAPIYIYDPSKKAVGLAHAGWRGTAANIAARTVEAMMREFGTKPSDCLAAVGPSIGAESYEVGAEVADQFRTMPAARAANVILPRSEFGGTYTLNLRAVIFQQLLHAGLPAGSIAVCDEDTYRNRRDFFRIGETGSQDAWERFWASRRKSMKRWFLVAVLVVLVLAFGFLKQGVHKSSMTEDEQQQAAQEAQKAQTDTAQAAAKKTAASPASTAPGADNPPAEEVVGDPATAKHHIEVGWIYEDTDAVNSDKLKAALGEVRTFAQGSGGTVSAVIADLDVPTEDRSPAAQGVVDLGVEVDGQSVYAKNPSSASPGTLTAALHASAHP